MASPKIDLFSGKFAIKSMEDVMRRAAVSALNKFGASLLVLIRRKTIEKYNIPNRSIDRRLSLEKATQNKLSIVIKVGGIPVKAMEFNPTQVAEGVQVEIVRGKPVVVKGAFIATRKVGSLLGIGKDEVFLRKTKARLPLRRTYDIQIQDLISTDEVRIAIKQKYDDEFADLLVHERDFFLSKMVT